MSATRNGQKRSRRQTTWTGYTDEQLLDMRICDLDLRLDRTPLVERIAEVSEELEYRGISFRPHFWLSDDWFSPDGVPVRFMHTKVGSSAIAEEFIDGPELYVGVMGNHRLATFPVWEMLFDNMPDGAARIATQKVKWDEDYQKRRGITTRAARNIPTHVQARIATLAKRTYRTLNLSGFARMDFRLRSDGRVFLLEANANPNLAYGEDFAESASTAGINYEELIQRIVSLGMRYRAPWSAFESVA